MNCPKCNVKLTKGEDKEFETLSDHVCDPNKESYPLRPTWECTNKSCPASKEDIFWDDMGDYYGYNINFKFDDDMSSAIPSFSRISEVTSTSLDLRSP